ncbi:MAG: hypothetical protein LBP22_09065 [Deltaproteobacteria bacterium]|nr:hypothetical protein [Deltaproteobacteria bacterium]
MQEFSMLTIWLLDSAARCRNSQQSISSGRASGPTGKVQASAAEYGEKSPGRDCHPYTCNSNVVIEGNILTLSETRAMLEHGVTIGGKSLRDHLEAIQLNPCLTSSKTIAG